MWIEIIKNLSKYTCVDKCINQMCIRPTLAEVSTAPGDIQACLNAGVLPACHEGTNIRVEAQRLCEVSCFLRHEDGTSA